MDPLVDSYGRLHDSLRISVTDRCNIRCFYCMPENGVHFLDKSEILSFEEIERFARVAARLGIDKLRLTGGEPLVRKNLHRLVRMLHEVPGIKDLALTTNAVLLAEQAQELHDAGLRRLNIHVDTLDRERFLKITRRDDLDKVLEAIELCRKIGFGPIKINAVALKGFNEDELFPLLDWCAKEGHDLTFIEVMPMGEDMSPLRLDQYWALKDLRARLASRYTLTDLTERTGMDRSALSKLETGQRPNPTVETLVRYAEAVGKRLVVSLTDE